MTDLGVILASLALGLCAGILSGMFGIGGGLIIVPALMFFFREPPKTAIGTSLFALVWPVGLLGVWEYWKNGQMRATQGIWIAVGLFVAAYFGARLTLALSDVAVKRLYAIFLLVMGTYLLYTTRNGAPPRTAPAAARPLGDDAAGQVH